MTTLTHHASHPMKTPTLLLLLAALLGATSSSVARTVNYATPGSLYTQNFDTLTYGSSGSERWQNGETIPGWHAINPGDEAFTEYFKRNGGISAAGHLIAMGADASDLALGFQPNSNQVHRLGLGLLNTSGVALDSLELQFRLENWRRAHRDAALNISLEFQVFPRGTGDLAAAAGWTPLYQSAAPQPTPGTGGVRLDGNALDNVITSGKLAVPDIGWHHDHELWLRWSFGGPGSQRHMIGLDDVTLSASPIN